METLQANWNIDVEIRDLSDPNDISRVYNDHYATLLNYGVQFNLDKSSVEDCIHDLFVDLWKNERSLREIKSEKAYLLRSLKNKIYKKLKKENKVLDIEGNQVENYFFQIQISTEQSIIISETIKNNRESLNQSIQSLTPRQRELIYHIFYNGLTYEEASEVLNISKKTAYNLVLRSINKLRKHLDLSKAEMQTVLFYIIVNNINLFMNEIQ